MLRLFCRLGGIPRCKEGVPGLIEDEANLIDFDEDGTQHSRACFASFAPPGGVVDSRRRWFWGLV